MEWMIFLGRAVVLYWLINGGPLGRKPPGVRFSRQLADVSPGGSFNVCPGVTACLQFGGIDFAYVAYFVSVSCYLGQCTANNSLVQLHLVPFLLLELGCSQTKYFSKKTCFKPEQLTYRNNLGKLC